MPLSSGWLGWWLHQDTWQKGTNAAYLSITRICFQPWEAPALRPSLPLLQHLLSLGLGTPCSTLKLRAQNSCGSRWWVHLARHPSILSSKRSFLPSSRRCSLIQTASRLGAVLPSLPSRPTPGLCLQQNQRVSASLSPSPLCCSQRGFLELSAEGAPASPHCFALCSLLGPHHCFAHCGVRGDEGSHHLFKKW